MGAALVGFIPLYFTDADGAPLVGGKLYSYVAGTSTPQATYTDSDLTTPNANPIILEADGRPADPIFTLPAGYKFVLHDADDAEVWTLDNWSDPGYIFSEELGLAQSAGAKDETSGYQVLVTDRLVTMDSTGGADPCVVQLPAAADFTGLLTVKNLGTIALAVTPDGADTIDTVAAAFTVTAGASPTFPSVVLVSDGVSAWYLLASHGL